MLVFVVRWPGVGVGVISKAVSKKYSWRGEKRGRTDVHFSSCLIWRHPNYTIGTLKSTITIGTLKSTITIGTINFQINAQLLGTNIHFIMEFIYLEESWAWLTLQPIASRAWSTTMLATVAKAVTLVSSRTTGQNVRTSTDPEITIAITMRVHCTHWNGMLHNTYKKGMSVTNGLSCKSQIV